MVQGFYRKRSGQMRLAHSWRAQQNQVFTPFHKSKRTQFLDLLRVQMIVLIWFYSRK